MSASGIIAGEIGQQPAVERGCWYENMVIERVGNLVIADIICWKCKGHHIVKVPAWHYDRFARGMHMPAAMPTLSRAQGEMFISGICGICWKQIHRHEEQ